MDRECFDSKTHDPFYEKILSTDTNSKIFILIKIL